MVLLTNKRLSRAKNTHTGGGNMKSGLPPTQGRDVKNRFLFNLFAYRNVPVSPELITALVYDTNKNLLKLFFNEEIFSPLIQTNAFQVKHKLENGTSFGNNVVTNISISRSVIELTLTDSIAFGDEIKINYINPVVENKIVNKSDGKLLEFVNFVVENKVFALATVGAGKVIPQTLTFNNLSTADVQDPAKKQAIIDAIAASLGINPADIVLKGVRAGSLIFDIEIKAANLNKANALKAKMDDPAIYDNNIKKELSTALGRPESDFEMVTDTKNALAGLKTAIIEGTNKKLIKLTFTENVAVVNNLEVSSFKVKTSPPNGNLSDNPVTNVGIVDNKVEVTIENEVDFEHKMKLFYTKTTNNFNNIIDTDGNAVDSFDASGVDVTNNIPDTTPPLYVSSVVNEDNKNKIIATFNEKVTGDNVPLNAFTITMKRLGQTTFDVNNITDLEFDDDKIYLTVEDMVLNKFELKIKYDKPVDNAVQVKDIYNNSMETFGENDITNNIPDRDPPMMMNASINDVNRNIVKLVINENVYNNSFFIPKNAFKIRTSTPNGNLLLNPITDITISNTDINLRITDALDYMYKGKIKYDKPQDRNKRVKDLNNNYLESFVEVDIINNLSDIAPPIYNKSIIEHINKNIVKVIFNEDISGAPNYLSSDRFTVLVNSNVADYALNDSIAIDASSVNLTLLKDIKNGDIVKVQYNKLNASNVDVSQNLSDIFGNDLSTFGYQNVENMVQPMLLSSKIEDSLSDTIVLTFDTNIAITSPNEDLFKITVNDNNIVYDDTTPIRIIDKTIELKIKTPTIVNTDNVKLTYVKDNENYNIRGSSNTYEVDEFSDLVITNTIAPRFVSASIEDADDNLIILSFDDNIYSDNLSKEIFGLVYKDVGGSYQLLNLDSTTPVEIPTNNRKQLQLKTSIDVLSTWEVLFSYTKRPDGDVDISQNLTGENGVGMVDSLSLQGITNNVKPKLLSAQVKLGEPKNIYVNFNSKMKKSATENPLFSVKYGTGSNQVNYNSNELTYQILTTNEKSLKISLPTSAGVITPGDQVLLSYDLSSNKDVNIRDIVEKEAPAYVDLIVENLLVDPMPILTTTAINKDTPNVVSMIFDKAIEGGVASLFTLKVGNNTSTANNAVERNITNYQINSINTKEMLLTFDGNPVNNQEKVFVTYTQVAAGASNIAEALTLVGATKQPQIIGFPITNNIPPQFTVETLNDTLKTKVTINFDVPVFQGGTSRWSFTVNNTARDITNLSLTDGDKKLQFDIALPLLLDTDVVRIKYTQPNQGDTPTAFWKSAGSYNVKDLETKQVTIENAISPSPIYESSRIESSSNKTIQLLFNEELNGGDKSNFVVKVGDSLSTNENATVRNISSLTIDNNNKKLVKLLLEGDIITNQDKLFVSYNVGGTILKSQSTNIEILPFTGEIVSNNVVPVMSVSELTNLSANNPNHLTIKFDVDVVNIVISDFVLTVNSQARDLTSKTYITGDDSGFTQVRYTIAGDTIVQSDTISLAYTNNANTLSIKSAGNYNIKEVPTQTLTVNNNVKPAPSLESTRIIQSEPNRIELTINENIKNGDKGRFGVKVGDKNSINDNAVARTVTSFTVDTTNASLMYITFDGDEIKNQDKVFITYTDGDFAVLSQAYNLKLPDFTGSLVTNEIVPRYTVGDMDNSNKFILMTFDVPVVKDTGNNTIVTVNDVTRSLTTSYPLTGENANKFTQVKYVINGDAVVENDVVKIKYTKPSEDNESLRSEGAYNVRYVPTSNEISVVNKIKDPPVYSSSKIETSPGNVIEVTMNEEMKGGSKDRFIVRVGDSTSTYANLGGSANRVINTYSINSNNKKQIELIVSGDLIENQEKVFVTYVPDAVNDPLQSIDDSLELVEFVGNEVTNNVIPRYSSSSLKNNDGNNANEVTLTFDTAVKNFVATDFTASVEGETADRTIDSVSYPVANESATNFTKVQFNITGDVLVGTNVVKIKYTKPQQNPLTSVGTYNVKEVETITVNTINNIKSIPSLSSSRIANENIVKLTFDEEMKGGGNARFVVKVGNSSSTNDNATARNVTNVEIDSADAKIVNVTFDGTTIVNNENVFISYTDGTNKLQSSANSVDLVDFTGESVTNETAPTFTVSELNNTLRNRVTLTFNVPVKGVDIANMSLLVDDVARDLSTQTFTTTGQNVDNFTVVRYNIEGNLITNGQVVKIKYTKPSTGTTIQSVGNNVDVLTKELQLTNVVSTSPTLQSSRVDNDERNKVLLVFSDNMSGGSVDRFTVKVGSSTSTYNTATTREVSSLQIQTTKTDVVLNINGNAILNQEKVYVSYNRSSDGTGEIVDETNSIEPVVFSETVVTNNVIPRFTVGSLSNANGGDGNVIELTFDVGITNLPSTVPFVVTVGGQNNTRNLSNRVYSEGNESSFTKVQYTIDGNKVAEGDAVTLKYNKPASDDESIKSAGVYNVKMVETTTVINVTNNVKIVPTYSSSRIETNSANNIELTFNEEMKGGAPERFLVKVGDSNSNYDTLPNTASRVVDNVEVVDNDKTKVNVSFEGNKILNQEKVYVSYTQGDNRLMDVADSVEPDAFTGEVVTNNVNARYTLSDISADKITVTFDVFMINSSLVSDWVVTVENVARAISLSYPTTGENTQKFKTLRITVGGAAITSSQTVTLKYTKPSEDNNSLRTWGNYNKKYIATTNSLAITNSVQ